MRVHWYRRDLRAADNRGLAAAAGRLEDVPADAPVVPLFVFDRDVLAHAGPPRVAFMLDALDSLREWYRERGSDLVVRHGDPREVVPAVAAEFDADAVTWGEEVSGLGRERDDAVAAALDDTGVTHRAFEDALLHEPGSIRTNQGEVYSVFTYFWKKWRDREKEAPAPAPEASDLADLTGDESLPTLVDLGFDEPEADVPPASTDVARDLLDAFCEGDVYDYDDRRDYPADECTSRLSAHLKFGTIGIREVHEAVREAKSAAAGADYDSAEEFESQLAWREFYGHVLWNEPSVVTQNFKSYERPIEWNHDPEALQAWKDGETGYPVVDAGMRQLRREAYMHNRVRMIVASFLTKDLLIDWREGYDWFREKLVDHDTANDNGGWQWAASTGTDAQPYFRVFNPMTQGERYDPDAEYIREYVPELRDVPADAIHEWHELDQGRREMLAPEYPAPIVDHSQRREQAIDMFERARADD
ncbi:deoxyribodipyrimidine photolyase [Halosimplex carlsbadense 2-9-1]|uniref:Deoxyribodipyrimidine photolyase n=1 Tax=Halosimplex carlsbadense 2-9-1 TaxID=797114 RepID=M0CTA3_9EURY|nr:deoxyribodipyrimidine photo-lyase [Halosimplex carlsbadense]ELZ25094.1 deoxyribodipyrimidine photolyase [Halosimplex carlsbadense 2-9-1]